LLLLINIIKNSFGGYL